MRKFYSGIRPRAAACNIFIYVLDNEEKANIKIKTMSLIWNLTIRSEMEIYCEKSFSKVSLNRLNISVSWRFQLSSHNDDLIFIDCCLILDYTCIYYIHLFNIYKSSSHVNRRICTLSNFILILKLHILINTNLFQLITFMELRLALTDA